MTSEPQPGTTTGAALARKLNLLLDAAEAEGRKITFSDVRDAMVADGTPLSRARWHYMRSGSGPAVRQTPLLRNLARFFEVSESYLLDEGDEIPAKVEAQLDLLASMRAAKIRSFAARQMDGLSADTLMQIRELLDEHISAEPPNTESAPDLSI